MAERRTVRDARRDEDDELAERADDELAQEPDGELAEEPDDEVAEEEPEEASSDADRSARQRSHRASRSGLTAAKAGQVALHQITELTGKEAEGVTGVEPAEDGWIVGVEVVEDRRVPSSTDILATYEVELDTDGELVSYQRAKRYTRGHGDGDS